MAADASPPALGRVVTELRHRLEESARGDVEERVLPAIRALHAGYESWGRAGLTSPAMAEECLSTFRELAGLVARSRRADCRPARYSRAAGGLPPAGIEPASTG